MEQWQRFSRGQRNDAKGPLSCKLKKKKHNKIGKDVNEGYNKTTWRRLCDAAAIHHCG